MADFTKALTKVLRWEGGYVDNPNDSGGATNKGITLTTYRNHFGGGKTKEDLLHIKDDEVEHIYKTGYWNVMKGDLIHNQSLAELIFDFVVNSGTGKLKQVQGVTGCIADGKIGPKTLEVWNALPQKCFNEIWTYRCNFYDSISKGKNQVFRKGWMRRLNDYKFNG